MKNNTENSDIAIIGMACRFPGAADYRQYWANLMAGKNSIQTVPEERWDWRAYTTDSGPQADQNAGRYAGFIEDIDKFDAGFFGIPPKEAAYMDPQHRLFLQCAWHAMEDAGYAPSHFSGTRTGVYCGVSKNDYAELMREKKVQITPFISTGTVHSLIANRLSFLLNLSAKSEVIDTACSSSLVALHNAITDIQQGHSEAAIVGGVNAILSPTMSLSHTRAGMLAPDGRIKTFDQEANGYVRGEGVAVIIIKPFSEAQAAGDHIHGIIKSVAVNHGGRSNFLTSPRAVAQAAVIQEAITEASIEADSLSYIECHGTGTSLGDPIEIEGIKKAYQAVLPDSAFQPGAEKTCALGSVKPNIGHLEPVAGLAGLIKVLLALQHQQLPSLLHYHSQNPFIELNDSPFYILADQQAWNRPERNGKSYPLRAGVSSFGMGGVNAHVIVEAYDEPTSPAVALPDQFLIPLSSKRGQLDDNLAVYRTFLLTWLETSDERQFLNNLSYTLHIGHDHYDERIAFVVRSVQELIGCIDDYLQDQPNPQTYSTSQSTASDNLAPLGPLAHDWVNASKTTNDGLSSPVKGQRIPLPGYAFERRRCWFEEPTTTIKTEDSGRYPISLNDHFFYLKEHWIQQQNIIPGSAYFEFVNQALSSLGHTNPAVMFTAVYWLKPCYIAKDKTLSVVLRQEDPKTLTYHYDIQDEEQTYTQGICTLLPEQIPPTISKTTLAIQKTVSTTEIYQGLKQYGIDHGANFQVLKNIQFFKKKNASAFATSSSDLKHLALNPCLIDGVFQVVTQLGIETLAKSNQQYVPFLLEKVIFYRPIPTQCWIKVIDQSPTSSVLSYDMQVYDQQETLIAEFTGLKKRILNIQTKPAFKQDRLPKLYYTTQWLPDGRKPDQKPPQRPLVVVQGNIDLTPLINTFPDAAIIVRYADFDQIRHTKDPIDGLIYIISDIETEIPTANCLEPSVVALQLVQGIMALKPKNTIPIWCFIHDRPESLPIHQGLIGFAKTLAYENPKLSMQIITLDDMQADVLTANIQTELRLPLSPQRAIRYQQQQRFIQQVISTRLPDTISTTSCLRKEGVYLIVGGTGGLGQKIAHRILSNSSGTVILLGRQQESPEIKSLLNSLKRLGGTAAYYRADVTQVEQVNAVIAQIKATSGKLSGVIYAAAVIDDDFILRKKTDAFKRILETKILGCLHIDLATQYEPLDFFVMFSSIAGLMPNQGQADYASGNVFLDIFSSRRNQWVEQGKRSGRSLAIDWPLWKDGGIQIKEAEVKHLDTVFGMKPLETEDGLAFFDQLLSSASLESWDQIILIQGDQNKIEQHLKVQKMVSQSTNTITDDSIKQALQHSIKGCVASTLKRLITPEDNQTTFHELGLDSLIIVQLVEKINQQLALSLNPTVLFEHNTLQKLTNHLIEENKYPISQGFKETLVARQSEHYSLIDLKQSPSDPLTFVKTFTTEEFYLQGHQINGMYNLPGACYLEMARQAGDIVFKQPNRLTLKNNLFIRQLSSYGESIQATIQLTPHKKHYAYEIYQFEKEQKKNLYTQGEILIPESASVPQAIRIQSIIDRCVIRKDKADIIKQIIAEGHQVDIHFITTQQIFIDTVAAIGELKLSESIQHSQTDFMLHPALLAGFMQTAVVYNATQHSKTDDHSHVIPVGIGQMDIYAAIPTHSFAYVTQSAAFKDRQSLRKFEGFITDQHGNICVAIKDFAIKQYFTHEVPAKATLPTFNVTGEPKMISLDSTIAYFKEMLAPIMGYSVAELDEEKPFEDYMINSVLIVEINHELAQRFGELSKTLFFEYVNLSEVSNYFIENHQATLKKLLGIEQDLTQPQQPIAPQTTAAITQTTTTYAPEPETPRISAVQSQPLPAQVTPVQSQPNPAQTSAAETQQVSAKLTQSSAIQAPAAGTPQITLTESQSVPSQNRASDIAIIGLAGHYPMASNLTEFWENLKNGKDCITEIPLSRFDYHTYYRTGEDQPGLYSKWGSFIEGVDEFDPKFFKIAPSNAELIDPQERLFLTTSWQCLEDAGYPPERLQQASVGVFVGAIWQHYQSMGTEQTLHGNPMGPSSLLYSIANRVSYTCNFHGPSLAVDTACSSSLTALHLACESLYRGESDYAISGGVNLSLHSSKYLFLSDNQFLSTDGKCRSFAEGGDGYVPGEGVGAVLLKPLTQAIQDEDHIYGVIRSISTNHGGKTNGYTVPNPNAQRELVIKTLSQAEIDPTSISYVEAHGTGTSLGDPIEMTGLSQAYGQWTGDKQYCAIGSVKSNIGHLEAAAGIVGLTKILLQLQHQQLVPSIHAQELNSNINFANTPFYVQRELTDWTHHNSDHPKRAALSSFGAGGSNVHLILEEAPNTNSGEPSLQKPFYLITLSAKSEATLKQKQIDLQQWLAEKKDQLLSTISYNLNACRSHFDYRCALIVSSISELEALLEKSIQHPQTGLSGSYFYGDASKKPDDVAIYRQVLKSVTKELSQSHYQDSKEYKEQIEALANLYVKGYEINWDLLYQDESRQKIPMPTYPFAKESYWIDNPVTGQPASSSEISAMLHPLLHSNISDLSRQSYSSTFSGKEFFLKDHQVKGQKVLPAVAYLEMARAAVEQALPAQEESTTLELRNIVWVQPIVVTEKKQITTSLFANDNKQIDYEIYSTDGDQETIHCQGKAVFGSRQAPAKLDIEQIEGQMLYGKVEAAELYPAFTKMGINYGPTHQALTAIYQGDQQLLAHLSLPEATENNQKDYFLHPSLMDSTLQASIALMADIEQLPSQPLLPFTLESLNIISACTKEMVAWVRYSPGSNSESREESHPVVKLDIDLCDQQGNVCVQMRGFSSGILEERIEVEEHQEETPIINYQKRTFSHDMPLLKDHRVLQGKPVVPGVTYLAMMIDASKEIVKGNVFSWEKVQFSNAQTLDIDQTAQVSLQGKTAGQQINFSALYNKNNSQQQSQTSEGILNLTPTSLAGKESFENWTQQAKLTRHASSFYLHPEQKVYGPSLRSVQEVYTINDTKVVGKIQLTATMMQELSGYVIHPCIFDACHVISTFSLTAGDELLTEKHAMPIMVEKTIVNPDFAQFQKSEYFCIAEKKLHNDKIAKIDLQLFSMEGELLCLMTGFTTKKTEDSINTLIATPVWQTSPVSVNANKVEYTRNQVILCEMPKVDTKQLEALLPQSQCLALTSPEKNIADRFSQYALACFELIQKMVKAKPQGRVLIQIVAANQNEQTLFAGLAGLLKTTSLESLKITGQMILTQPEITTSQLAKQLQDNQTTPLDDVIKYQQNTRQVLSWQEMQPTREKSTIPFKDQGVYLITGGLGSLGLIFAKELLKQIPTARIILTGRSELSEKKQTLLTDLSAQPGQIEYQLLDICDPKQVTSLLSYIQQHYKQLNGIIHSAGMISDNFIVEKTSTEFSQVLAPKVAGTIALDQASQGIDLDFLVLFSSITGAIGNPGQADYATANAFMDRFAAYRNNLVVQQQRKGKTLAINWGLWQEGGMSPDETAREVMKQTTGVLPTETATGLKAFHQSLNSDHGQTLVVQGLIERFKRHLFPTSIVQHDINIPTLSADASQPEISINLDDLQSKIQAGLIKEISETIKINPQEIQLDMEFSRYGFESKNLMNFVKRLNQKYELELMPTIFFEYTTVRSFADYLIREHKSIFAKQFSVEPNIANPGQVTESTHSAPTVLKKRSRFIKSASPDKQEEIAIIGMDGLFAESQNIESFWNNIASAKNLIKEVPVDHWDYRPWFDEDREKEDKTYCKWGSFIDHVDKFDTAFFNISPREAEWMDPQLRLLLQSIYKTAEDAGLTSQIRGSNTGVFVGVCSHDYTDKIAALNLPTNPHSLTGNAQTVIANRISFQFDLTGPSLAIDTACSSSLFALHQACHALRNRECGMAFVGGVNLLLSSPHYRYFSSIGALSPTGRCHTFDAKADGYVPGEAIASILLKPLQQAIQDNDQIYAVIKGSAALHGGFTPSLTAPSVSGEKKVIVSAWKNAGIDPSTLSYVEAHGTGTKLGDPIEITALTQAFEEFTQEKGICAVGSAKSNIGHTEGAAGIVGVIKVVEQMRNKQIPAIPFFEKQNPYLQLDQSALYINKKNIPWTAPLNHPRRAGVSSFGFSGAYAHAVIEEYQPPEVNQTISVIQDTKVIIPLSARTAEQLQQKARDLLEFINTGRQTPVVQAEEQTTTTFKTPDLMEMAYTLQTGREAMEERLGFLVSSVEQLSEKLRSYIAGEQDTEDVYQGQVSHNNEDISIIGQDDDMKEAIEKWLSHKKLSKLLNLWVKGLNLDWDKLYGEIKPQRISLPTYPFAKERYWIDDKQAEQQITTIAPSSLLHPLLHRNTSNLSLHRYTTTLTGGEFFLNDHQVRGQKVLPAVAYLEMARVAVEKSSGNLKEGSSIKLRNVVWAHPIIVNAKAKDVHIGLTPQKDGVIQCEIYTEAENKDIVVNFQGVAEINGMDSTQVESINIEDIKRETDQVVIASDDFYQAFESVELNYGTRHQGIVEAYKGENLSLGRIKLPSTILETINDYVLHPSIMDSALQSSIPLELNSTKNSVGNFAYLSNEDAVLKSNLPVSLKSLETFSTCTENMFAVLRSQNGSKVNGKTKEWNIDLCDERGNVCVKMEGLQYQEKEESVSKSNDLIGEAEKTNLTSKSAPSNAPAHENIAEVDATINDYGIAEIIHKLMKLPLSQIEETNKLGELGLDSILTLQLLDRIEAKTKIRIHYADLVNISSIKDLVKEIDKRSKEGKTKVKYLELEKIRPDGNGLPVFWIHGGYGTIQPYIPVIEEIGGDFPFYGIQAKGLRSDEPPIKDIIKQAEYYTEIIFHHQKEGPYQLGGYSHGGRVAYETCRILQQENKKVKNIVMLDSAYPFALDFGEKMLTIMSFFNFLIMHKIRLTYDELKLINSFQNESPSKIAYKLSELGIKRGLRYTVNQLTTLMIRWTSIMHANLGAADQYAKQIKALPHPEEVKCFYFLRKQPKLSYGPFLADVLPKNLHQDLKKDIFIYKNLIKMNQVFDRDEVGCWKKLLPDFTLYHTESDDHLTLFSNQQSFNMIVEKCREIYGVRAYDLKKKSA